MDEEMMDEDDDINEVDSQAEEKNEQFMEELNDDVEDESIEVDINSDTTTQNGTVEDGLHETEDENGSISLGKDVKQVDTKSVKTRDKSNDEEAKLEIEAAGTVAEEMKEVIAANNSSLGHENEEFAQQSSQC